jgi:glyoxylase-like metal-dependent hydrolase (beta-lactamase superfamily II)
MEPWMRNAYIESITPVHQAGLTMLWEQPHFDIDASLRLSLAPGHTPGSAVLWLRSGTDRAVFVGDLFHSPLQMVHPDQGPCFDERPDQARRTRTGLLEAAVEQNALIIPAHFPGAGAVEVFRRGDGFHVRAWRGAG